MNTLSIEAITGLPEGLVYAFVFVFGALIGSFLNVVIHRVPRELSIVFPNSACPKCGTAIKFYDNIPILSWLVLGGKCRTCREPIAVRYPLVEFANALLYCLALWSVGFTYFLPVIFLYLSAMLCLILIDAEHMILPNVINFPLLFIFLGARLVYPTFFDTRFFTDLDAWPASALTALPIPMASLAAGLFGGLVGGGFLWLIGELWKRLRGIDAMGLGDVKMMFAVGALLGWKLTLLAIFLGAVSGAVIGVAVIAKQKDRNLQTQIPFGIFLGIGSVISLLAGESLITWYMDKFVP